MTKVIKICKEIKNHFWEIRPKGSNSSHIITNGPAYEFLIKAFSMYHTEWYERTSYAKKISFYVSIPKEYNNEKNKCFFLRLDGKIPKDAPISHNFSTKDKGNLQQVEDEGSYRGIRSCRHVVEPDSCSILTLADSSRRAVSFRKDTSEMLASEGQSACRTVDRLQAGFRMQR